MPCSLDLTPSSNDQYTTVYLPCYSRNNIVKWSIHHQFLPPEGPAQILSTAQVNKLHVKKDLSPTQSTNARGHRAIDGIPPELLAKIFLICAVYGQQGISMTTSPKKEFRVILGVVVVFRGFRSPRFACTGDPWHSHVGSFGGNSFFPVQSPTEMLRRSMESL